MFIIYFYFYKTFYIFNILINMYYFIDEREYGKL